MAAEHRLPPGQQLAAPGRWPVIGERAPEQAADPWQLEVTGLVAQPLRIPLAEVQRSARVEREIDIHCVTRWSMFGVLFQGWPLLDVLARAQPQPEARYVSFVARSSRRHSTSLPLADLGALDPLVAVAADGHALDAAHGGPLRLIVPGRYFYKSLKWLARIELVADDVLGYWERTAGYHNQADPWREQRYLAPQLDRAEVRRRLAARDFSAAELCGMDAAGHDLTALVARDALLRDARFGNAVLKFADFSGANLSNAHFDGADLCDAVFHGADLEGASFIGADLRGADFSQALLTAATLFAPNSPGDTRVDARTRFDAAALEQLMPEQSTLLRQASAAIA
ncbi:MAG: molybdopterin-dependent oxidoreductase [Pirellulales bacterium]|nr:molybdopterin-dependent oxidoreductase [Pirellulales bacterium]